MEFDLMSFLAGLTTGVQATTLLVYLIHLCGGLRA